MYVKTDVLLTLLKVSVCQMLIILMRFSEKFNTSSAFWRCKQIGYSIVGEYRMIN